MLVLTIHTDNAAFEGEGLFLEVARILEQAAAHVASGQNVGLLRDSNGNSVGKFDLDVPDKQTA